MTKLFYKFSLLMALITFLTCVVNGISLITCVLRSFMVMIGVLFTIFVAGYILQFGIYLTTQNTQEDKKA